MYNSQTITKWQNNFQYMLYLFYLKKCTFWFTAFQGQVPAFLLPQNFGTSQIKDFRYQLV